jgi:hypothetical protein
MYTVQYKFFFFGFLDFFFRAANSQCQNMANALKRAIFVWEVDEDEMEDEG